MLIGFHMQNGFKTIKIDEVNLYGRKTWNFHFFINNTLYETKNTDDKHRYIKHLEQEYYFEECDENEEFVKNMCSVRNEVIWRENEIFN